MPLHFQENLELENSLFLPWTFIQRRNKHRSQKFAKNELLVINIDLTLAGGQVIGMRGALAKVQLTSPACTEVGGKVVLSRHIEKHWWLVAKCFGWLSRLISYLLDVTRANLHMYHLWSTQMQVFFISVVNMFIEKSGFPDQRRLVGNNKNIESIVVCKAFLKFMSLFYVLKGRDLRKGQANGWDTLLMIMGILSRGATNK